VTTPLCTQTVGDPAWVAYVLAEQTAINPLFINLFCADIQVCEV